MKIIHKGTPHYYTHTQQDAYEFERIGKGMKGVLGDLVLSDSQERGGV